MRPRPHTHTHTSMQTYSHTLFLDVARLGLLFVILFMVHLSFHNLTFQSPASFPPPSTPSPSLLPFCPSSFTPPITPQIYRLSVDNCDIHSSCLSCVQSANPLCGWCSTEGRCMPTNGCSMANTFTSHNNASSCPAITNVSPRQAYIVNNETVSCALQC